MAAPSLNKAPNIIVAHPTGNANVRAIVRAAYEKGILRKFHTTISQSENSLLTKILPSNLANEFTRRNFDLPEEIIKTYPIREIARLGFSRVGFNYFTRHESGMFSVDAVYREFDKSVAGWLKRNAISDRIQGVYAYEDGALETFKLAKKFGMVCFYDLPIAYWEMGRRLLQEEAERQPLWAETLGGGISDSPLKLERKEEELQLADVVIGPGKFVLNSLPSWSKEKDLIMSAFGSPLNSDSQIDAQRPKERPLRVLFVGSMGQRKGLGDLFDAMNLLKGKPVELVVLGSLLMPISNYRKIFPDFIHEAGRPHADVLELMSTCDVFCLPSIVEGRALVMQEAMSRGLPIIITPNTGGEDLVIEGETGFLVPIRSPESIANKIEWFINNRSQIGVMGEKARTKAQSLTWEKYGNTVVDAIIKILDERIS